MKKSTVFKEQLLEYEIRGNGLPVMFVHGFTEDRGIWEPLLKGLEDKYQFVLPDMPGSGSSPYNSSFISLKDFAEVIRVITDQENIQQFVLIGHSMGGYISLAFAEKYPEKLLGLGLFHSSAYPDSPEKKEVRDKNIGFIERNGPAPYIDQSLPGLFSGQFKSSYPETINELIKRYNYFRTESLVQYLTAMKNRPDTTQVLKTIPCPVLFIIGKEDKSVLLEDALKQSHLPKTSYIHILSDNGHMGMIENTEICRRYIDEFLTDIGRLPS